jgi:hypothetical protein
MTVAQKKKNPALGGVFHIGLIRWDYAFFSLRFTGIQMRLLVR